MLSYSLNPQARGTASGQPASATWADIDLTPQALEQAIDRFAAEVSTAKDAVRKALAEQDNELAALDAALAEMGLRTDAERDAFRQTLSADDWRDAQQRAGVAG